MTEIKQKSLRSKTLGKDLVFDTYSKDDGFGGEIQIIKHDSLESVIHNETNATYAYKFETVDTNHTVVQCVMTDKQNHRVVGIGESIPETLENEIARNYPSLIASQRAFDRAAIRYLALPGKVLSNLEVSVVEDCFETTEIIPENIDTGIVSTVCEDDYDNVFGGVESINSKVDNVADTTDDEVSVDVDSDVDIDADVTGILVDGVSIDSDADSEVNVAKDELPFNDESDAKDYSSYVVSMNGKYAGKNKTIAEIYAKDAGWLKWVAEKFNPTNPTAKKDVAAIKEFMKNKGE